MESPDSPLVALMREAVALAPAFDTAADDDDADDDDDEDNVGDFAAAAAAADEPEPERELTQTDHLNKVGMCFA